MIHITKNEPARDIRQDNPNWKPPKGYKEPTRIINQIKEGKK